VGTHRVFFGLLSGFEFFSILAAISRSHPSQLTLTVRQLHPVMEVEVKLFKGINVVSISVSDLDQARQFYRDVLSLGEPIYDLPDAGWIEFESGGPSGNIAVTKAETHWQPNPGTTIVLNVEDCHAAYTELRRRGVRCEDPVVFPGYVTFCSFYDPFGNRLQMCSPPPSEENQS
jgi:predicted enzyme related to lactoylglutathione lyase